MWPKVMSWHRLRGVVNKRTTAWRRPRMRRRWMGEMKGGWSRNGRKVGRWWGWEEGRGKRWNVDDGCHMFRRGGQGWYICRRWAYGSQGACLTCPQGLEKHATLVKAKAWKEGWGWSGK
ncbi:unnamed protein product, partial [Ectocarpus sp. 13 AM-2016]